VNEFEHIDTMGSPVNNNQFECTNTLIAPANGDDNEFVDIGSHSPNP